jgi:kynureninase
VPRPGAAGYQLSNPSALDLSAVVASLEIFGQTSMAALRAKSISLTTYLEKLLLECPRARHAKPFAIITSSKEDERGAQLSLRLDPGLLDGVLHVLEESGVVVDERKPDVIRVAPAPLYNSYVDVWDFAQVFFEACVKAVGDRDASINCSESHSIDSMGANTTTEVAQAEVQVRGAKSYEPNAK